MFTPTHLDELAINIRKRSAECLDNLPVNEVFDWVDKVSIELTTQMLAVLFDFPWEDRRKLTRWSDVATTLPGPDGLVATDEERQAELIECATYFARLWKERINQPPKSDLLSMMAHSDATRDMDPKNFLGNLILLIVGGNDTTRNTLSGSIYALNKNPDQYRKLRDAPLRTVTARLAVPRNSARSLVSQSNALRAGAFGIRMPQSIAGGAAARFHRAGIDVSTSSVDSTLSMNGYLHRMPAAELVGASPKENTWVVPQPTSCPGFTAHGTANASPVPTANPARSIATPAREKAPVPSEPNFGSGSVVAPLNASGDGNLPRATRLLDRRSPVLSSSLHLHRELRPQP